MEMPGRLLEIQGSNPLTSKSFIARLHRLYDEGLEIAYLHRKRVPDYISAEQPSRFLRCATHTGWHSTTTYFLVNGQGKTRSNRYGEARPVQRWRVALLSSGEHSIKSKLALGNITAKEGQLLRIVDVPSNGHFGLFDNLHGFSTWAGLADAIRAASNEHYGHAGPAFVKILIGLDAGELAVKHAEISRARMHQIGRRHIFFSESGLN